jgi:hypothetical protein
LGTMVAHLRRKIVILKNIFKFTFCVPNTYVYALREVKI